LGRGRLLGSFKFRRHYIVILILLCRNLTSHLTFESPDHVGDFRIAKPVFGVRQLRHRVVKNIKSSR
jgi:hypothetical protein